MVLKKIDISSTLDQARAHLNSAKLPSETRAMFSLLIMVVEIMLEHIGANSKNSSLPPSQDPNRKKTFRKKGKRKPGGQKGHNGTTLEQTNDPDEVIEFTIDRRTLPSGKKYTSLPPVLRQVVEISVSKKVIEYRAEVLSDENGNVYYAPFPSDVNAPIQYGSSVKAFAVYLSVYQLLPYERVKELISEQFNVELSTGTIANMIKDAFEQLACFEKAARVALMKSELVHCDETGVNLTGKNSWLHSVSNEMWTLFAHHTKRGSEAIDEIGFLPNYSGIAMHDNWQSYFKYSCEHALCNAHHLRELTRAFEDDSQKWAKKMHDLLLKINNEVNGNGGSLSPPEIAKFQKRYNKILRDGEKECPPPEKVPGRRGRQAKGKSRCLLERLKERKTEALRFMEDAVVPFSNNLAERDIRMTKVHQKVSGCFRSVEGVDCFCRIRSFFSTCRKHGLNPLEALSGAIRGYFPEFIKPHLLECPNQPE